MFRTIVWLLLLFGCCGAMAQVIKVSSQQDFDQLQTAISNKVAEGNKQIEVQFEPKTYYFREQHLSLQNKQWKEVSLSFYGNGATIVAKGEEGEEEREEREERGEREGEEEDYRCGFVDLNAGDLSSWGPLRYVRSEIEVIDEELKICRLRHKSLQKLGAEETKGLYVQITQWYKSGVYKVLKVNKGSLLFEASDLSYNQSYKCWNVNLDLGFGGQLARFRLSQKPTKKGHRCAATRFLVCAKSQFKEFRVEGLRFLGNMDKEQALMQFTSVSADSLIIASCRFEAIRSNVIWLTNTHNTEMRNCEFEDCYRYGFYSASSKNTKVLNNHFRNMGLALQNTMCIRLEGDNFLISDNEIEDFGYCGIAAGLWWGTKKTGRIIGSICHNHLYYTSSYKASWAQHTLMDSGAIYLFTQNDSLSICHNFVHDISGAHLNRGIFCDDGASNLSLIANIVLNIANSFAIDSRLTLSIEKSMAKNNPTNSKTTPQSFKVNTNNTIRDNIVDGNIRFQARDSQSNCRMTENIYLATSAHPEPQNQTSNILIQAQQRLDRSQFPSKIISNPQFTKIQDWLRSPFAH